MGDLDAEAHDLIERERALLQAIRERLALQVLHHQEVDAVLAADVVEDADVRMAQRRDRAGLALEALASLLRRRVRGQDLDGDDSLEARVAGPVDLAHSPRPEG